MAENGGVYPISIDLVKEEDVWKMINLDIGGGEEELQTTEAPIIYQLASSVDLYEEGERIDGKDIFAPDERITISGFLSVLSVGTQMSGRMLDDEGETVYSTSIEFEEGGNDAQFYFYVEPNNDTIPPGEYTFEVTFYHESFDEPVGETLSITVE